MGKSMYQPLLLLLAELLPLLTDDLVIEILAHLPVKSLLRFKCVSKSWCNLIKSNAFISNHFSKHQSSDKLVLMRHNLVHPSSEEERAVLSFHDMDSPQLNELWPSLSTSTRVQNLEYGYRVHRLIGPCNGLVLVVDRNDVFVCNPSLRELKLLPHCPFSDPRGYYRCSFIDDDIVASGWGFGSTRAHDFNVVHLQCCYNKEYNVARDIVLQTCSLKAHLYKAATSSWKNLGYIDTMFTHIGYRTSELFFTGACHWHTDSLTQDHPGVILTFDMSTEIFGQMGYPKSLSKYSRFKFLMVLNDCLALVWYMMDPNQPYEVWVMKEYGNEESWSPLIAIEPQAIERPLLFRENELLIENNGGQLASCLLHTNEIKRFPFHGIEKTFRAVTYKESLISPLAELGKRIGA